MTLRASIWSTGFVCLVVLFISAGDTPANKDDTNRSESATFDALETMPTPTPSSEVREILGEARRYWGLEYRWGGRATEKNPGMDCMGLVFRAYATAYDERWTQYSVLPSKLIASGMVGVPVSRLDGTLSAEVDASLLQAGDVLFFLADGYEIRDEPLLELDGNKYWPWHMGIWTGNMVIHAAPGSHVRIQPLSAIYFDALFVTRRVPAH